MLRARAGAVFHDANVVFTPVDVSVSRNTRHLAIIGATGPERLPVLELMAPKGYSITAGLPRFPNQLTEEEWDEFLAGIVDSPVTKKITEKLPLVHSVILLIEGEDAQENAAALEMARESARVIEQSMALLPKPAGRPPILEVLPWQARDTERVLCWSLGVDFGDEHPSIAVIYGRGRRIGVLLDGGPASRKLLMSILSKVGLSCECGLDPEWIMGLRYPAFWDSDIRAVAVQELGFDPENPLVRIEIGQILDQARMNPVPPTSGNIRIDSDFGIAGYTEQEVPFVETDLASDGTRSDRAVSPAAQPVGGEGPDSNGISIRKAYYVIAISAFMVICIGVGLLIRGRRGI
jgi:hypothetical protein